MGHACRRGRRLWPDREPGCFLVLGRAAPPAGPALFATIKLGEQLTITPDVGLFFGLTEATPSLTLKFNVGVPLIEPSAGK